MAAVAVASMAHAQDTTKRGRKYKAPPPTSHVEVTVLRATNGKPVENASVIFHPLVDGRDNGNMELKTNDEGKAVIDLLNLGSSVRLQIIAPGFQTYGEDYQVDKDNLAIEIKLKRPSEQYSIYKKSEGRADPSNPPNPLDKSAGKPKDAAPQAPSPDAAPKDAPPQDASPDAQPDKPADPPQSNSKPPSSAPPH